MAERKVSVEQPSCTGTDAELVRPQGRPLIVGGTASPIGTVAKLGG
jgi:hypothetical protein